MAVNLQQKGDKVLRVRKTFHVVVNPAGASGRTGKVMEELLPKMQQSGQELIVHYSRPDYSIRSIVREVTAGEDPVNLIIVGGDGTLNEAVNGIRDLAKVRLGLLPIGSGNDFARGIGLTTSDPEALAQRILKGEVHRSIDVGEVIYHSAYTMGLKDKAPVPVPEAVGKKIRFLVSAGIGFDAEICHEASVTPVKPLMNRLHLGQGVYILSAIHLIFTSKLIPLTLTLDGGRKVQHYKRDLFTVAMNERYEGGGYQFCPEALDDDGIFHICSANPLRKMIFFMIFPTVPSGKHWRFRKTMRPDAARTLEIKTAAPRWVHQDGETPYMSDHLTIDFLDRRLDLLM